MKAARSGAAEQAEKSFGSKTGQGPDVTADDMVLNLNEAKEQGFKSLVDTSIIVGHEKTYILR